jgi:hypothetical protein
MDLFSVDKLLLFLFFFIPGFVSLKVYDWLVPGQPRKFGDALLEIVGLGFLNYAILFLWWLPLISSTEPDSVFETGFVFQVVLITCVCPALWPLIYLGLSSRGYLKHWFGVPVPSAWDCVFSRREWFFAVVHLKDGRRIGGLFGPSSYASSFPSKETLYLEQLWSLDEDGELVAPARGTKGVVILGDQIELVEVIEGASGSQPTAGEGNEEAPYLD